MAAWFERAKRDTDQAERDAIERARAEIGRWLRDEPTREWRCAWCGTRVTRAPRNGSYAWCAKHRGKVANTFRTMNRRREARGAEPLLPPRLERERSGKVEAFELARENGSRTKRRRVQHRSILVKHHHEPNVYALRCRDEITGRLAATLRYVRGADGSLVPAPESTGERERLSRELAERVDKIAASGTWPPALTRIQGRERRPQHSGHARRSA